MATGLNNRKRVSIHTACPFCMFFETESLRLGIRRTELGVTPNTVRRRNPTQRGGKTLKPKTLGPGEVGKSQLALTDLKISKK
jgi:hypothetical protein